MSLRVPMHSLVHSYGLAATLVLSGALGACGDSGGGSTETTNGPTTMPSTSEPLTTTGASSTTATASDPTTTSPTGTATEATSDGTGSVTGDLTTGGPTTGATTGDDTTSDGTTGDGTTGGGDIIPCETDKDCTLADGCCECNPIGPGETPKECNIQCFQTVCSSFGLEGAAVECKFGRCTFEKVLCNPLGVNCNAPMPDCPPGQVPSVEDTNEGKCWKGFCVPAEACDWVPDCNYCSQTTEVCVGKLQKGAYHVCEPKPVDCGDETNIDCGCGEQICEASPPHTLCHDAQDDIDCECPFC